jgi:ABC-type glycerol-3-phosphate transport system substrate-binding protein
VSGSLVFWSYQLPVWEPAQAEMIRLFNLKYPNVEVTYEFVPIDEYLTKIVAAAGTGTGPDLLQYIIAWFPQLVATGSLGDITQYWDAFPDKDQFPDPIVLKSDGNVFGIRPLAGVSVLFYNKDVLDAAGVTTLPTTQDELTDALAKVKANTDAEPLAITGNSNVLGEYESRSWLSAYGFDYNNPTQEALEAGFQHIADYVAAGYLSPEAAAWDQTIPTQRFLGGNVAFVGAPNGRAAQIKAEATFEIGVIAIPPGPSGGGPYIGGEGWSIGAFGKSPELAFAFLAETFYSKEGQLYLMENQGGVPNRFDARQDPRVTGDPFFSSFVNAADRGVPNPPPGIDVAKIPAAQLAVGQNYSAVIAGLKTPEQAAADAIADVLAALQ